MVQGSVPTPYIFADYGKWEDAAECMMYWYLVGRDERKARGLLGREWLIGKGGLNAETMCNKMIDGLDSMMANWKGRESFNFHRHDEYIGHKMPNGNLGVVIPVIDKEAVLKKFN